MCDAAVLRSDIAIITIRPSWCQDSGNVERNLGPLIRDHSLYQNGMWSYIIISDLAAAIVMAARNSALTGHERLYIAAPDNIGGRDLKAAVDAHWGAAVVPMRELSRPDASGISSAKAERLLGWKAEKTWRSFLDGSGLKIN